MCAITFEGAKPRAESADGAYDESIVSYSPLQARDRRGRWVAKAGNAAFNQATKTVGAGHKAPKIKRPTGKSQGVSTRPTGLKGLKRSTIPYVRVNKRSQTAGVNAGTIIPGTHKRIVGGAYLRLETTTRHTTADKIAGKVAGKVFPKGTRRGRAASSFKRNFSINNPALRATARGHQVRLSTSRGAGPTVVVRRGRHKTSQAKSAAGIKRYDARMRTIAGAKAAKVKKRPARRKAARRR